MPSQMDLLCSNSSNGELPQSYLRAAMKNKRHMIHKQKNIAATSPSVVIEQLATYPDIPPDVEKVLRDLEMEEIDNPPDEQQMEVLEDIWLKAGEMGKFLRDFLLAIGDSCLFLTRFFFFLTAICVEMCLLIEHSCSIDIDEATVYDDGYNRKKSKKRKRKQSVPDKEKSKPKKRASKVNAQNASEIPFEIKTEVCDGIEGSFEDMSHENIDEIPVLQGSYNDSIIIECKEDPLKIDGFSDFPESSMPSNDQLPKKKKKHPERKKRSEQKKERKPRSVAKSKRKQVNMPTFDDASDLSISDANAQCKNMPVPEICIPRCSVKDVSNSQSKVNVLSGNIISVGNELSMINVKDKTVVNITTSDPTLNLAHGDDQDAEKLMSSIVENRATSVSTTTNVNNIPIRSTSESTTNTVQSLTIVAHKGTNFECQIESAKPIAQNANTPASTNYKSVLKAPKLSILKTTYDAPRLTPQVQVDNFAASEKDMVTIGLAKPWTPQETKTVPGAVSFLTSSTFNQGPPVLQNETMARYTIRPAILKPPASIQLQPDVMNQVTAEHSLFNKGLIINKAPLPQYQQNRLPEIRPKNPVPPSSCKTYIKGVNNWGNSSLNSNVNTGIVRVALPTASKQDNRHISSTVSIVPASSISAVPAYPVYTSAQITPINSSKAYIISPANFSTANPTNLYSKATAVSKEYKSSSRGQKAQRGGNNTARKKPAKRNIKSANNLLPTVSQTNVASTSVGTQVDQPILLDIIDPSCTSITISRVTDNSVQSAMHSNVDSSSVKSPIIVNPVQRDENECSNMPDNKPLDLQQQTDGISLHLPTSSPKTQRINIIRRKSKEKLRKVTIEKKEVPSISSTSEAPKEQGSALVQSADVKPCNSQAPSVIIPGHVSEMIHPNVPSIELLRAFNDYWSAQISHCAICATFASCSTGSSRVMPSDWRYCKAIDLPESSPIWVRKVSFARAIAQFEVLCDRLREMRH